jgi:hypothetical protein
MNEIDPVDERLVRLLGAARAPADPAVLARARARLAGTVPVPGPLAWLGTPAALVTACALFVVVAGASIVIVRGESATTHDPTLMSALIGDDGSYGLPTAGATGSVTGLSDTGTVTP